ncbi:MAG: hypothetical protein U0235_04495 [Polyangiaceae bacterium]
MHVLGYGLGRPFGDDAAAAGAAFGPRSSSRHLAARTTSRLCSTMTVLGVDEALQHFDVEPPHVVEVEAGGGLVEDVERLPVSRRESSLASLMRWASPPESVVAPT